MAEAITMPGDIMDISVTLLTSIVATHLVSDTEDSPSAVIFDPAGEPHAAALVAAVAADYHQATGRTRPGRADLLSLVGSALTLSAHAEGVLGAQSIRASEGVLFLGERDRLGLLPRGARNRGHVLNVEAVLDVEPGYGHLHTMMHRVQRTLATLPRVEALTREHLLRLPERAGEPHRIGVAVFATWHAGADMSAGAIWLLHSYEPDDDIAEGYLILRPQDGTSESGSVYGRQLIRTGGRIIDPPDLDLRAGMNLGSLPYHEALARFVDPHAPRSDRPATARHPQNPPG